MASGGLEKHPNMVQTSMQNGALNRTCFGTDFWPMLGSILGSFWCAFGAFLGSKLVLKSKSDLRSLLNGSKMGLRSLTRGSPASQTSPKDTILVSFWTPELESSGPEDQEPGTGTGSWDLKRRGPVARRISELVCLISELRFS